jgi:hypothetical protein
MKKVVTLFYVFILFNFVVLPSLSADPLSVHFNNHTFENKRIKTSYFIVGDISYDTVDAIRNGITAKLFVTIQLSKSAGFLGIGKSTFVERAETFDISFDVWDNSFIIEDKKRKNSYHAVNDYEIISTINSTILPLTMDISPIRGAERLYLRAKIKIQTIKLFPPFGIFLLFFDPWNYESDWESVEVVIQKSS